MQKRSSKHDQNSVFLLKSMIFLQADAIYRNHKQMNDEQNSDANLIQ